MCAYSPQCSPLSISAQLEVTVVFRKLRHRCATTLSALSISLAYSCALASQLQLARRRLSEAHYAFKSPPQALTEKTFRRDASTTMCAARV